MFSILALNSRKTIIENKAMHRCTSINHDPKQQCTVALSRPKQTRLLYDSSLTTSKFANAHLYHTDTHILEASKQLRCFAKKTWFFPPSFRAYAMRCITHINVNCIRVWRNTRHVLDIVITACWLQELDLVVFMFSISKSHFLSVCVFQFT